MAYRRAQMHRLQELVRLHRYKTGARETARLLGMGPNTERQYREAIASAGLLAGSPEALPSLEELRAAVESVRPPAPSAQQISSLERYRPLIVMLSGKGLGPRAIFDDCDWIIRSSPDRIRRSSECVAPFSARGACSRKTSRSQSRRRPARSRKWTSATLASCSTHPR